MHMKNFFPPLLCLLVIWLTSATSVCAATKSEQVAAYLGTYRYENDKPVGTVKFIFQRAVYTRTGNGRKSYAFLLTRYPGFTDDDGAGTLLAVQVVNNGQTTHIYAEPPVKGGTKYKAPAAAPEPESYVAEQPVTKSRYRKTAAAQVIEQPPTEPEPQPQVQSTDPVRPYGLPGNNVSTRPNASINLPDSSMIRQKIDGAKETVTGFKAKLWQTAQPVWEFVMWIFNSIIVFLICLGGLFRYIAKTAASETAMNQKGRVVVGRWIASAHENAAGLLLIVTWIIAIFLLLDAFMWLIYLNLPIWTLAVIWFPILWVAEKLTNWIVPNIPVLR
jgi:hypothetical protein